jgi:hypothetical protein
MLKLCWQRTKCSRSCTIAGAGNYAWRLGGERRTSGVDNAKTPEAIRAIRNLFFLQRILGSIPPESLEGVAQAIPEGIAQATAERDRPVSFFSLFRRLTSKDSLRGLAEAVNFLQAFGRHLRSAQNSLARD